MKKIDKQQSPKEELFAYAYIRHMGNATAAAREVFQIKSDAYAAKRGSEMVRKRKVQALIDSCLNKQREHFQKFVEQGPFYLTMIAQKLLEIIQDDETSTSDCLQACETLARFCGVEVSEAVTIARIRAEGSRPEPMDALHSNDQDSYRKTIFMLSPPPMPFGFKPPPALAKQWEEMGWKPGYKAG